MNRLEKKCFIGAAAFHGLLIGIVLFGAAFLPSQEPLSIPPIVNLIAIPTDKPFNSGGNPNASPQQPPPPAAQPPKPPEPQPQPPQPVPPKPEVVRHEDTKPTPTKRNTKPVKDADEPVVKKNNTASKLVSKTVVRTNAPPRIQPDAADRAARDADRRHQADVARQKAEQQRIAGEIGGIVGSVNKSLGKSTVVGTFGPGGEAFVNYRSLVQDRYERAWQVSPDLADDDSVARARVTVRRDGSVMGSVISQPSSNASLNKSVQRALEAVTDIGMPFPAGAKEEQRSFTIEFNLKTRKAVG